MRYLHPIGLKEKLIALGEYSAQSNERVLGIVERWSIHQQPDGARLIRADFQRDVDSYYTLSEVWVSPPASGERIERLDVLLQRVKSAQSNRITYQFLDDHVEIGRTIASGDRLYEEYELPKGYIVTPYVEAARGAALVKAALNPAESWLITPQYVFSTALENDPKEAFKPLISKLIVRAFGKEEITIDGKRYHATRYEYGYDHLQEQRIYLVDDNNIVLKYEARTKDDMYLVLLGNYLKTNTVKPKKHD